MMIEVQSQTETRRCGPVAGLDQPCSRKPTAALPLVGSDPYVPCTPSGERGATGWGTSERWKDGAAQLVSCDNNTGQVPFCVVMLSPVVSGAGKGLGKFQKLSRSFFQKRAANAPPTAPFPWARTSRSACASRRPRRCQPVLRGSGARACLRVELTG